MESHIVEDLHAYAAGELNLEEIERVEAHLCMCAACRRELADIDGVVVGLFEAPSSVLQSLTTTLGGAERFSHLRLRVASLFDVDEAEAKALLASVDDPDIWQLEFSPGVKMAPVQGGPKVEGALTVLVRLEPGAEFPMHAHGGREQVLVLEGGYRDISGVEMWRGELDVREAGTSHSFVALPGQGCLCAALMYPVEEA